MLKPLRPSRDFAPKEQVADQTPMRIGALNFGIASEADIRDQSSTEISDRHLYDAGIPRQTTTNGPLDKTLGNVSKTDYCETCGQDQRACNGHWGFIKLYAPCYHVGFLSFTIEALNQVCKTCSKLLLEDHSRRAYIKQLRRTGMDAQQRKNLLKRIQAECRKVYICPHCSASNGPVRKVPGHACKVVHLKFDHFNKSTAKSKKAPKDKESFDQGFNAYLDENPDMDRHVRKAVDDLLAIKAHSILSRVSTEDCELMGVDIAKGRPESYLWTCLPVPPNNIRPSVPGEQATTEDELTAKLSQIIDLNSRFKAALDSEEHPVIWMDLYEKLQDHIAMYINSHAPGLNKTEYGKAIRSFCTRLKGKQGRFRGNLSGKRVNFSGRTVIGPDPNLSLEELGVPIHVAKILTYPERVNKHNIDALKAKIKLGSSKWPGANLVHKKGGRSISVRVMEVLGPKMHKKISDELVIGDVVDRHVINGDIVLFNRQPSLHKLSILCHRVRVHPGRTLRFNESVCNPYNADFDGDEMNIHVPQTEEARTEALELMGVKHNLVTPKNGAPIIAPIQDFITAAYLLSSKDRFFTRMEFAQIMGFMFDGNAIKDPVTGLYNGYELPPPTVLKPKFMWTGKQIFNVLMKPNRASNVRVNAEAPCRQYKAKKGEPPDLSDEDAYLVVRNSQIMCGVLDKSIIGDGKKCSIFYGMLRDYGEDYAIMGMNRMAKLSARWLGTQGFSIGIGDVYPSLNLTRRKKELIDNAKQETHGLIMKFAKKELGRDAGCNEETTLENKISGLLSGVRQQAGNVCFDELMRHNSAVIMAKSGSKGSLINVSQMVASVGQQMIGGARVQDGFQDRSLPHFRKGAREPAAKGFVENSFFTGLTPYEFIFHAMSGREGLVDTAVKTAETGYMSRRLIKSLEDNSIAYDDTVRTSSGSLVQFRFGDDSIDPAEMEGKGPVDLNRTWVHALETTYEIDVAGLHPDEVLKVAKEVVPPLLNELRLHVAETNVDNDWGTDGATSKFLGELQAYLDAKVDRLRKLSAKYNQDGSNTTIVDNILKITDRALREFLRQALTKYRRAIVQPGHAVGAIAAQSIGEPGTQMTLKTFHFAGVAGMSITQGVPRIKEIINAAKKISTPIISCELMNKTSAQAAQIVKGRIEKTYLRDIAASVEDVHGLFGGSVRIKINMARVAELQLEIGMDEIIRAIATARSLKLEKNTVQQCGKSHIVIKPEEPKSESAMEIDGFYDEDPTLAAKKAAPKRRINVTGAPLMPSRKTKKTIPAHSVRLNELKRSLLDVVVGGFPDTTRAVIKRSEKPNKDGKEEMQLLVEGYGLKACMATPGVVGTSTRTNNVMETFSVLGIEAARTCIIQEMDQVMGSMDIDSHHIALMACTMTCKGEVLGITRFGMSKFKDSVLQLASFEKTPDHLFEAATRFKHDKIEGVSESIIMGQPVRLGTGIARVVRPLGLQSAKAQGVFRQKESLFDKAYTGKGEKADGWYGVDWSKVGSAAVSAAA